MVDMDLKTPCLWSMLIMVWVENAEQAKVLSQPFLYHLMMDFFLSKSVLLMKSLHHLFSSFPGCFICATALYCDDSAKRRGQLRMIHCFSWRRPRHLYPLISAMVPLTMLPRFSSIPSPLLGVPGDTAQNRGAAGEFSQASAVLMGKCQHCCGRCLPGIFREENLLHLSGISASLLEVTDQFTL